MKPKLNLIEFLNYDNQLYLIPAKYINKLTNGIILNDLNHKSIIFNKADYQNYKSEFLPIGIIKPSNKKTVNKFKENFDGSFKDIFDTSPEKALEYWSKKSKMKISWNWNDWKDKSLEMHSRMFTVAKVLQADLLQTIYDGIQKGIQDGMTNKEAGDYLEKKLAESGWSGSQTVVDPITKDISKLVLDRSKLEFIYNENLNRAMTVGRFKEQSAFSDIRTIWAYRSIKDERTTNICNSLDGLIAESSNVIWKTAYPPNHFRCRAYVDTYTKEKAKKENIEILSNSKIKKLEKPAEGFNQDPTKSWSPETSKYTKGIKSKLEKSLKTNKSIDNLDLPK